MRPELCSEIRGSSERRYRRPHLSSALSPRSTPPLLAVTSTPTRALRRHVRPTLPFVRRRLAPCGSCSVIFCVLPSSTLPVSSTSCEIHVANELHATEIHAIGELLAPSLGSMPPTSSMHRRQALCIDEPPFA
jgi:hypothetical protein